jgi:hypothetical protein
MSQRSLSSTQAYPHDLSDDTTFLRDMVRDVFGKDDIELHALPPPPPDNYYMPSLFSWEDDGIFD